MALLLTSSSVFAVATRNVARVRQVYIKRDFVDVCVALDEDIQLDGV